MHIKKILQIASLVMFIAMAAPASASMIVPPSASHPAKTENPRAEQLLQRLDEISKMNKSELTRSERKSLRKEVKQTRKEMKSMSGGIYLSVGAVIIIILLLILIL